MKLKKSHSAWFFCKTRPSQKHVRAQKPNFCLTRFPGGRSKSSGSSEYSDFSHPLQGTVLRGVARSGFGLLFTGSCSLESEAYTSVSISKRLADTHYSTSSKRNRSCTVNDQYLLYVAWAMRKGRIFLLFNGLSRTTSISFQTNKCANLCSIFIYVKTG